MVFINFSIFHAGEQHIMSAEPKEIKSQVDTEELRQTVSNEQKQWLQLAYQPGDVIECRILKVGNPTGKFFDTYAGYYEYSQIDKLISDLWPYCNLFNPKGIYATGVYTVLNPINPDLLARSYNKLKITKSTATDEDILYRRWLPIDCDPSRPADISSTSEEKKLSFNRAKEIRSFLIEEIGFPEKSFIYANSGNGSHLPVFIENLPNDDVSKNLTINCLRALDNKFTDNKVKIDNTVFNASRIWKLYGSIARKGDSIPSRRHSYAKILEVPEKLESCPKELLEKLASLAAKEEKKNYSIPNVVNFSKNNNNSTNLDDRINNYIDCIPSAISGNGGHNATFYVADVVVNGFNLSIEQAMPYMHKYNERCQPPWTEGELLHKVQDAFRNGSTKPKGYLLKQNDNQTIAKWNDECLSDANLEEINIHDLKRNQLVRIRGQKWIGQVNKINDREITVYFKNKNALVTYDISELVWKNDSKNCFRSNTSSTSTHQNSDSNGTSPNDVNDAQPEETQNDTNERTGSSPISEQELFLLISSIQPSLDDGEYGDAKLFAHIFQDQLVFDHSIEKWYRYNGVYWQLDETNNVILLVAENLTKYYQVMEVELARASSIPNLSDEQKKEIKSLVEAIEKRIAVLKSIARVSKVLKFAESILGITGKEWDQNPLLLGVANGVLDLKTGELLEGNPTNYIKTVSSVEWKGLNESCPRFEQFLEEIFENKSDRSEIIAALHRLFGYSITGESIEHIFPIFIGEGGRNGKDTLFETLGYVLGAIASTADRDCLIDGRRDTGAATPYLRELKGKRLVWVSETRKGSRLNTAQVKYITGGNRIKARGLNENLIEFDPTHTMCLLTNYKPHIDAEDNAIWERLALVSFDLTFKDDPVTPSERQRDPNLKNELRTEASGILAWLVRGCLNWQHEGLKIPVSMREAKEDYRKSEDTLSLFIEECCIKDINSNVSAKALYAAYKNWSGENNLQPKNGNDFGQRMAKRFEKKHTYRGQFYFGINLLENVEANKL